MSRRSIACWGKIVLAVAAVLATQPRDLRAVAIDWVGDQEGRGPVPPDVGSFFDWFNWAGYTVPGPGDVAVFDTSLSGAPPNHIYFGAAWLTFSSGPSPVFVAGGNATNQAALIGDGHWTFDFGTWNAPGGTTGNYTLTGDGDGVSLRVDGSSAGSGSLTVAGPGTLTADQKVTIGGASGKFGELGLERNS